MDAFILGITIAATLVQLTYWLGIFSRLANYKPAALRAKEIREEPFVSIIICARNEAENLSKFLDRFLNQTYRSFEIIVINDHSSDETEKVVLDFQAKNPTLCRISLLKTTLPGKKAALERGISAAKGDIVLLSDADCEPASQQWLALMQAAVRDPVQIALGYSPYRLEPGLLNAFIRFETTYTAIQYLSFALMGLPYMGVGRNLAYRKSLFEQAGGFEKHRHVASGDDDLFVNAAANSRNTTIVIEPGAFVYSEPKRTWQGYYHQKSRHLTTGRRYKGIHQVLLGGLSASHFLHYAGCFVLCLLPEYAHESLLIYLARTGVVALYYARITALLKDRSLIPWVPLLDAAYLCYYIAFLPALITGKRQRWK
ncbi:MAG: glycosyltransferase [Saprospiraceae bacterium]|nr:glycosyltransferase [Saprospiraceae bacterium]